jgi:hypothetical protein
MSNYQVVHGNYLEDVVDRVNYLFTLGYVPLGVIATRVDRNGYDSFFQAMVKEKE